MTERTVSTASRKKFGSTVHPLFWMLAAFIAGLGTALLFYRAGVAAGTLEWELAKMSMQVAVVGVAGALFSFIADNYQARQEKRRAREDYLRDVMERMTASYNKSKGARRMARAKGLSPADHPTHVRLAAYDKCVETVNEAQLELEAVMRDLATTRAFYPQDAFLHDQVDTMQRYLNRIVSEYEKVRLTPGDGEKELSLLNAEQFKAFSARKLAKPDKAPAAVKPFGDYAHDHDCVRDAINSELLDLAG